MIGKRGSVPLLVCGVAPAILLTGMFVAEATNAWLARSRLQAALDAGALIAARDINSANRDKNVRAVVAANYNANLPPGAPQLDPNSVTITSIGTNQVQVGAGATVNTVMRALGGSNWTNKTIARTATANRTDMGIELALIVDTTLSMGLADGSTDSTGAKPARIEWAKRAALALVSKLYGSQTLYQPNLYISVVPFNVAINVGNGSTQQGWLTGTAPSYTHPTLTYSWSGCVEARRNGYDVLEDAPARASANSLFYRYYWPNTYVATDTSLNNASCTTSQDYNSVGSGTCWGNNDWGAPLATQEANPVVKALRVLASNYGTTTDKNTKVVSGTGTPVFGPNFMCPRVSVLPLTMHRPTVEAKIQELIGTSANPYPFSYGTVITTGLQGAWYTLSPSWQGVWPASDPSGAPSHAALPLPYNTSLMKKVVVLLSDGDNNWYNAREPYLIGNQTGTGTGNPLTRPESRRTELFYNAYGVLSATAPASTNNRLNVSPLPTAETTAQANSQTLVTNYTAVQPRADAALDDRTRSLCTAMKQKGIIIYAVGVGIPSSDTNAMNLLADCVTPKADPSNAKEPSKFINTTDASKLVSAFEQIASELSNLRLSQ